MLSNSAVELSIHITLVVYRISEICELFNVFNFLLVYKGVFKGLNKIPFQHIVTSPGINRKVEHSCMVTDWVDQVLEGLGVTCKSWDVVQKVKVGKTTVVKPYDT